MSTICPRCHGHELAEVCPACALAVRADGETLLHEIIDYLRKWAEYELWCDRHGVAA